MEPLLATLFWLGQACFVIQAGDTTILIDPFNAQMGYEIQQVNKVDAVTVSHEHGDHNNVGMAAGEPLVLRGLVKPGGEVAKIDQKVKNVRIYTVASCHDAENGNKRGKNAIFVYEIQSANPPLRIVHLGDFGEKEVGTERVKAIGAVDVLLIPVGGFYTMDSESVNRVIAELKPRIVVPMHVKTSKTARLPIETVEPFLKEKKNVLREGAASGNRLAVTGSLLKKAQESGEPLIVPLEFGPPPQ